MMNRSYEITCNRCGKTGGLWWASRKDGSRYLAVILPPDSMYRHAQPIRRPHVCPDPEEQARYNASVEAETLRDVKALYLERGLCIDPVEGQRTPCGQPVAEDLPVCEAHLAARLARKA